MKLIWFFILIVVNMSNAKSFGEDGAGQLDNDDWFDQYMDEKDQEDIAEEGVGIGVEVDAVGNLKSGL
jgi:hypothetical protein